MGVRNKEESESFRSSIRRIYAQKMQSRDFEYDFMDNEKLVTAVTEVRIKSDVINAGSLVGALANRTNAENMKLTKKN